jgi:hypothetical protein
MNARERARLLDYLAYKPRTMKQLIQYTGLPGGLTAVMKGMNDRGEGPVVMAPGHSETGLRVYLYWVEKEQYLKREREVFSKHGVLPVEGVVL